MESIRVGSAPASSSRGGVRRRDQPDFVINSAGMAGPVGTNFILLTPFFVCLKDLKANVAAGIWPNAPVSLITT